MAGTADSEPLPIEEVEFANAKVEVAVLLFPATRDHEQFETVLLATLRLDEQREQARSQCQMVAVPAESAPAHAPAAQRR